MNRFDLHLRTRVVFGIGEFSRLGELSAEYGFRRTLLVADKGMVACGYVDQAVNLLEHSGIQVFTFQEFGENPDSRMVETGSVIASEFEVDSIIGLGGGSSLDCAKGINFLLAGGGRMEDYRGFGKLSAKSDATLMLPMIAVPTTAGTGSEAQCYTLVSDAETQVKMACGDPQAAFKLAILDPQLTITQPRSITATAGYDAISHAVESYVTRDRNPVSDLFALEAWRLLEKNYAKVLSDPENLDSRAAMQLGAYYAGVAIEHSMLGATHACANPLTKNYGTSHGIAIAVMLPKVVRWNNLVVSGRYKILTEVSGISNNGSGESLSSYLERLADIGGLPGNLSSLGVTVSDLEMLAGEAAIQWTGNFNPREWTIEGAREVYESAL